MKSALMKTMINIIAFVLAFGFVNAQEKFTVPELTTGQQTEVLYQHVIAYAVTGISFAKSQHVSPMEYGKFIGEKFAVFWNPDDGFPMLVNRMMYILSGLHPGNEMQIIEQNKNSITFKMKNVDLSFRDGPMFDVTYQDFLDCSQGIVSVIANRMGATFSYKTTEDGWYVIIFSK